MDRREAYLLSHAVKACTYGSDKFIPYRPLFTSAMAVVNFNFQVRIKYATATAHGRSMPSRDHSSTRGAPAGPPFPRTASPSLPSSPSGGGGVIEEGVSG